MHPSTNTTACAKTDPAQASTGNERRAFELEDGTSGSEAADAITTERCRALLDHAGTLVRSEPTTLAGVVALVRYVAGLDEWQTPVDHTLESFPIADWHQAFLSTLANALDKISSVG